MDARLKKAIMTRKPVPSYYMNVPKFLELYGVSGYKNVCMNRIRDRMNEYDSLDDVTIDIINGFNMCLTESGVKFCKDILTGYVKESIVNDFIKYISAENRVIDSLNTILDTLKACDDDTLRAGLLCPPKILDSEHLMIDYADMIRMELKARQPLYLVYTGIKNKLSAIWFQYQNRHKLKAFMRVVSKYE